MSFIEVIKCKCGCVFAQSVIMDDMADWNKNKLEYLEGGCETFTYDNSKMKVAFSDLCDCPKTLEQHKAAAYKKFLDSQLSLFP